MAANGLPKHIEERAIRLVRVLVSPLVRRRVHPNVVTTIGFVLSLVSGVFYFLGHVRIGGALMLAGGIVDSLDGELARGTGQASAFGSFYDSTLDRMSEILVFVGIFGLYAGGGSPDFDQPWMIYVVALAMGGSLMVSYTRAQANKLGLDCQVGLMQRLERLVLLGCASVFFGGSWHGAVLTGVLILMAVLTNFTAFQRIAWVYRHTRDDQRTETMPLRASTAPSPKSQIKV